MSTTDNIDYDVGIIGGGPAGSAMGFYLAQQGVDCVILEKELFPRHHVGESLVPAANRVIGDMGLLEKMDDAGFPRKFGAVWTTDYNEEIPSVGKYDLDFRADDEWTDEETREGTTLGADIGFGERKSDDDVDLSFTWHVDRAKFDNMLLERAAEVGADVYQGVRVSDAKFSGQYPNLQFRMGRSTHDLRVKCVVDASGRRTFLGNKLGLRVMDPNFQQMAVYSWYEGFDRKAVARNSDRVEYIYIHFLPISDSWVWQIPISDEVTSIGVVTQKEHFGRTEAEREEFFWECLQTRPELHDELRDSNQILPMLAEGDYSYAMEELTGDNFVLIGDAARFVDPIFSSGVSVALNSARLAKDDILEALDKEDYSKKAFSDYESTVKEGVRTWYRFITLYYRLNILFTYYLNDDRYRNDLIKLLQGEVYSEDEVDVLDKMEEVVDQVEQDPEHPWHDMLSSLRAQELKNAV